MDKQQKVDKILEFVNGDLTCSCCPLKEKCDNINGASVNIEDCAILLFSNINNESVVWDRQEMKEYNVRFSFDPIYVTVAATSEEEAKEFARHKFDVEHMNRAIKPSSVYIPSGYTWE